MSVQPKIKCAIYARVSSERQGDSIENQISLGKEYIRKYLGDEYDADDVAVYQDEAVSGYYTSVFEREAIIRAREEAKQGKFSVILFKEVSRVGRDKQENPAIIGLFEQYGVRVIAMNENYDTHNKDTLTFDILNVMSEQESKKISSRVSSAKRQKASRGLWNGEPPLGYRLDPVSKRLVIDPDFAAIPRMIFRMYQSGQGTFTIAQYLNQSGYLTKKGNLWSRKTVRDVLSNPAYIGRVVYGTRKNVLQRRYDDTGKMTKRKMQQKNDRRDWIIVEDAHEPLIEAEAFWEVQQLLQRRRHHQQPRRAVHPLTGLLVCGQCGAGMVCQKRRSPRREYRYYICKTYHKYGRSYCRQSNLPADDIEAQVVSIVSGLLLESIPVDSWEIRVDIKSAMARLEKEITKCRREQLKWEKEQRELFRQRDLFTEEGYRKQMLACKNKLSALEAAISQLQQQQARIKSEATQSCPHILHEYLTLSKHDQSRIRTILHEIIQSITVDGHTLHFRLKLHRSLCNQHFHGGV